MCAAFRGFRAEKAGRFCLSEGKPVSDSCDFSFVRLMLIWKIIMAGKTLRHLGLKPSHPGELLREIVIPATRKTKVEIARLLGISRQSLHDILSEKAGSHACHCNAAWEDVRRWSRGLTADAECLRYLRAEPEF